MRARLAIGLAASVATAFARAASPYDAIVDDAVARYHLPGIAVGVIEDGKVVYTRTVGETAAGSGKPITPNTLFKIASNSKAMTSSTLARLVQAGKLRWDDPVAKYLPQFRMFDPWVSEHMQVRDLLVHSSGLREGAGDLMLWPEPNRFTRADIIAGLRYLKPAYSFRAGYAYDNLLYVVAGEVAASAGGASYETLVRREVFEPLGLSRCHVGEWSREEVGDVAQPHMRKDDRNVVVDGDDAIVPAITSAAAGGIRCSVNDMLVWARNWIAPDAKQRAWLSVEQRRIAWTSYTPMPISDRRREWDHSHVYSYGLGWRLSDVDGVWTVSHTGTLSGMYSVMTLLPDKRAAFVVLMNGEAGEARTVLNEALVKHFTDPTHARTIADYVADIARDAAAPKEHPVADTSLRKPATLAQLKTRLGIWRDPWFGEVSLCARGDAVRFNAAKSPVMAGTVKRVGERDLVAWDDAGVDAEAWLDFADKPVSMSMTKVDPQADFSFDYEDLAFARVRDCP